MATSTPLTFKDRQFLLKGKPLRIFSGAIHYFRVVPEYWEDRLVKARACGLNTVETYVPWNLHEPKPGYYCNDGILDFRRFINMAAELGMYVIFRPGPYICSEWDFGGLPSWLLADPDMKVRSNYKGYQDAVKRYFDWLLPQITDLQHSEGGPIIALQIENEFGSFSEDGAHLEFIRDIYQWHGISELLVTSDYAGAYKTAAILEGVLPTANGQLAEKIQECFEAIRKMNDQYPLMVMELWCGWFDHWGRNHDVRSVDILVKTLEFVFQHQASVNFYMFHGGTNFGFMAGAEDLSTFDVTSYDYNAPVAEDGSLTEKFFKIKEMIEKEWTKTGVSPPALPELPQSTNRGSVRMQVEVEEILTWSALVKLIQKKSTSTHPQYMETYSYGNRDVQSYGYIIYRKDITETAGSNLSLPGHVRDNANILINGQTKATVNWETENPVLDIERSQKSGGVQVLDVVVENLGRVNYTTKDNQQMLNSQRKGLNGPVKLDDSILENWQVLALDFCDGLIQDVRASQAWTNMKAVMDPESNKTVDGPALYRASFQLLGDLSDYFVRLDGWHKGIVIINGFNLGRYWEIGPQRTLYLPGPLLKHRNNEILVFEERSAGSREIALDIEPFLE